MTGSEQTARPPRHKRVASRSVGAAAPLLGPLKHGGLTRQNGGYMRATTLLRDLTRNPPDIGPLPNKRGLGVTQ